MNKLKEKHASLYPILPPVTCYQRMHNLSSRSLTFSRCDILFPESVPRLDQDFRGYHTTASRMYWAEGNVVVRLSWEFLFQYHVVWCLTLLHRVCRVNVRDRLKLTVVETVLEQWGVVDDSSCVSHLARMGIYQCSQRARPARLRWSRARPMEILSDLAWPEPVGFVIYTEPGPAWPAYRPYRLFPGCLIGRPGLYGLAYMA